MFSPTPDGNLIRGHLDLILLSILHGEPKYGLEISKQAQERTGGYFDLRVGSLYPALHRLEKAGFIRSEFKDGPRGGSPVKVYALTEEGGRELDARRQEFEVFSRNLGQLWKTIERHRTLSEGRDERPVGNAASRSAGRAERAHRHADTGIPAGWAECAGIRTADPAPTGRTGAGQRWHAGVHTLPALGKAGALTALLLNGLLTAVPQGLAQVSGAFLKPDGAFNASGYLDFGELKAELKTNGAALTDTLQHPFITVPGAPRPNMPLNTLQLPGFAFMQAGHGYIDASM